jgi:hypothetical protein
MDEEEAKFVRGLSKIRNRLVHNVRYTTFELVTYVNGLDSNSKEDFARNTCNIFTHHPDDSETATKTRAAVLLRPKPYLWLSGLHVIAMAGSRIQVETLKAETDGLQREIERLQSEKLKQLQAAVDSFSSPAKVDALSLYMKHLGNVQGPGGEMGGQEESGRVPANYMKHLPASQVPAEKKGPPLDPPL